MLSQVKSDFFAPTANPVFSRTYSRWNTAAKQRESWNEVCDRTLAGAIQLGKFSTGEFHLLNQMQRSLKALPSGRWLWVGGTPWLEKPENFSGAYNCTGTEVVDWRSFGLLMELAMMGCGTGAVLESRCISQLPVIRNRLQVSILGQPGGISAKREVSTIEDWSAQNYWSFVIKVGDSRQGWVQAYESLLHLASAIFVPEFVKPGLLDMPQGLHIPIGSVLHVQVELNYVRPQGERLHGFGGVANPCKLPELFPRVAHLLNGAIERQLTPEECCLLIDEASRCVVAGNVRRSAGIRQFDADYPQLKLNLWSQDEAGNWQIDPKRDALRMANHTRVYHRKPTLEECWEAVHLQYESGEGAIQWAGEAVARSNSDLICTTYEKKLFLENYDEDQSLAQEHLQELFFQKYGREMDAAELHHRIIRYALNPCGEIISSNFHCNLSEVHLNRIDPLNLVEQNDAFTAGALFVAGLLHHQFTEDRYQEARSLDPIVGVSFTGLFDFFVNAFGVDWLRWWEAGRPIEWHSCDANPNLTELLALFAGENAVDLSNTASIFSFLESSFLNFWQSIVHREVWKYCDKHGLKCPNRCTTVQPSGTKSLLTGASPGWHPPKAQRCIRRITFAKNDPVALACLDYGYNVVPAQSDTDEQGNLLNDPFSPRCTEWLVEIPVEVSWANLPGADQIDISKFSALAQLDFYMQVQQHYTAHNTSATIELREPEIEAVARRIYEAIQNDEGYISATLLARFDDHQSFPRLPFEPIDQAKYDQLLKEVLQRQKIDDFYVALSRYDQGEISEAGPAGCDSDKCLLSER
jgi:ribonucleotide reductase class II